MISGAAGEKERSHEGETHEKYQIPSDLVVKSQGIDIIYLILQLIRHPNGVTGHIATENRGGRRSQHLQSSGLPLNAMECEKYRGIYLYAWQSDLSGPEA